MHEHKYTCAHIFPTLPTPQVRAALRKNVQYKAQLASLKQQVADAKVDYKNAKSGQPLRTNFACIPRLRWLSAPDLPQKIGKQIVRCRRVPLKSTKGSEKFHYSCTIIRQAMKLP